MIICSASVYQDLVVFQMSCLEMFVIFLWTFQEWSSTHYSRPDKECKQLEFLSIFYSRVTNLKEIVAHIALNCQKFRGLSAPFAYIGEEEAATIFLILITWF